MISDITSSHAASPQVAGRAAVDAERPEAQSGAPHAATYAPVLMWFEQQAKVLVTQFRNPETGELRVQYPAPSVVQRYSESNALGADGETPPDTDEKKVEAAGPEQPEPDATKTETPAPATPVVGPAAMSDVTATVTETATAATTPKASAKVNLRA